MQTNFKIHLSYLSLFLLIIAILFISNTSPITFNDIYLSITFVVLLIIGFIKKIKIDPIIFYITSAWIIINIISYIYNRTLFPILTIISYIIRLLIPYLVVKIIGNQFWLKLEKAIFILTIISIPIYTINLLFPDVFIRLDDIFGSWAADVYKLKSNQTHFWYAIIYTYTGRIDNGVIRNSGFMWEPGAFAMILSIVILFNWFQNNFKLSVKIMVYLLALITTFSTMGYISLFLLIILYITNKRNVLPKVIVIITILYLLPLILSQEFIMPKIQQYITEADENKAYLQKSSGKYEMNRITTFVFSIEKCLRLPTGFGSIPDKLYYKKFGENLVGVNGLGSIMVLWGWIGLFFLLYSLKKFTTLILVQKVKPLSLILVIGIFLLSFFSNPIERNFLLFAIVLTPFIKEFQIGTIKENTES